MKTIIKKMIPNILLKWYRNYRNNKSLKTYLQSSQGDNVECPICSSKFKEFGAFGLVQEKMQSAINVVR